MNILIISSGFYPVTNKLGGAIENLIETYLLANEKFYKNNITLYSVKTQNGKNERQDLKYTNIRVIDKTKLFFKLKRIYYAFLDKVLHKYKGNAYFNFVLKDLKEKDELNKYDYIIIENIVKFVPLMRKYTKSKIVLHLHNDYLNSETFNGKSIVNDSDYVWCVSEFIAKQVSCITENKDKIKVLYNGIDLTHFKNKIDEATKEELRRNNNIDKNDIVFLYVGRLMKEKGVEELIIAFKNILKKYGNCKLIIVGGSREINVNKDKYVKNLYSLSRECDNKIKFTGRVEQSELYRYYSIADIQVIPSICNEAFGMIVLEGMASKLPLIVSNVGGIPEIARDNAIYVEKDNIVGDLEKAMKYIIKNPVLKKNMIVNYDDILNKFSKENYCNKFNELLK